MEKEEEMSHTYYMIICILLSSFIYSQCLGDVNDDYTVDIQDIVLILNTILYLVVNL